MRMKLLGLAIASVILMPGAVFAGCDWGVADNELVVAEPMTEQQILDLIAETRQKEAPVEQVESQTDK